MLKHYASPCSQTGQGWQHGLGENHYGQTYYALVVSSNPRTESQQANRSSFGSTGPTWGLLTDEERAQWRADARHYRTHGRPGGSAPTTGFQRYMSVNAKRAREGLPPLRPCCHSPFAVGHSPPPSPLKAPLLALSL